MKFFVCFMWAVSTPSPTCALETPTTPRCAFAKQCSGFQDLDAGIGDQGTVVVAVQSKPDKTVHLLSRSLRDETDVVAQWFHTKPLSTQCSAINAWYGSNRPLMSETVNLLLRYEVSVDHA